MKYLDANFLIFGSLYPENNEKRILANKIAAELNEELCTSTLTWDEYVFVARKLAGKEISILKAEEFLKMNIRLIPPDRETLEIAQKQLKNLKPRDAIHVSTMLQHKIKEIISDDTDFDNIKGIKRIKIN